MRSMSWQVGLWAGSSCLAHCLQPSVIRFNSWLQTRLQLGFRSLSLAVGVKKHLLIWVEECSFVSVAPNQSSAGKLEWVRSDLLIVSMKGVICPSVHSFIDKPHWVAWQGHLRWRIRWVCVVTLPLLPACRNTDANVLIKIVLTSSTITRLYQFLLLHPGSSSATAFTHWPCWMPC